MDPQELHYFPQFYSDASSVPHSRCAWARLCLSLGRGTIKCLGREAFSWAGPSFVHIPFFALVVHPEIQLQVQQTLVSSVTEEISQDNQVTDK